MFIVTKCARDDDDLVVAVWWCVWTEIWDSIWKWSKRMYILCSIKQWIISIPIEYILTFDWVDDASKPCFRVCTSFARTHKGHKNTFKESVAYRCPLYHQYEFDSERVSLFLFLSFPLCVCVCWMESYNVIHVYLSSSTVCMRWVIDLNDIAFGICSIENEDFHFVVTMATAGNTIFNIFI